MKIDMPITIIFDCENFKSDHGFQTKNFIPRVCTLRFDSEDVNVPAELFASYPPEERAEPWDDGIDSKGLWTTVQTGPSFLFDRHSTRNDALWADIVQARKLLIAKALAWRAAAMADGWTSAPTYPGHEAEERAFSLTRDGFKVHGLARPAKEDEVGTGQIFCWGPDRLHIPVGETYDWKAIQAGVTTCQECHAENVATFRAGFAGRYCFVCLPKMRAAIETPGWCA